MKEVSSLEPTIVGSVIRYRVLVAAIILICTLGSVLLTTRGTTHYTARAQLVVQDPRTTSVFGTQVVSDPQRYVADQVAIIQTPPVFAEAADSLTKAGTPTTAADLEGAVTVRSFPGNSLVEISATGDTAEQAVGRADAVVAAYEDVSKKEAQRNSSSALDQLDASIKTIDDQLVTIQDAIDNATANTSLTSQATLQFRLSGLLAEQQELISRRSGLQTRRDEIVVDTDLSTSGIVLRSSASGDVTASSNKDGVIQRAIIAAFLGAVLGTAAAYALALRRRRFTSRFQPETILEAPLMSDIPDFESERISSLLPVLSQPATASAEAYRFVAASIQLDLRQRGLKKFAFVSAARADGKTVTVANVAIALAQSGLRVLAIDADPDSQDLTRMLYRQPRTDAGLSEVLQGSVPPAQAIRQNSLDPELSLVVLPPGMKGQVLADPAGDNNPNVAFETLCERFDVVLLDAPAFLGVASAGLVVSLSDASIAVVRHGGSPGPVTELHDRLVQIGRPTAGYVYNRAPLRQELLAYYAGPTMVKAER